MRLIGSFALFSLFLLSVVMIDFAMFDFDEKRSSIQDLSKKLRRTNIATSYYSNQHKRFVYE